MSSNALRPSRGRTSGSRLEGDVSTLIRKSSETALWPVLILPPSSYRFLLPLSELHQAGVTHSPYQPTPSRLSSMIGLI